MERVPACAATASASAATAASRCSNRDADVAADEHPLDRDGVVDHEQVGGEPDVQPAELGEAEHTRRDGVAASTAPASGTPSA